MLLDLVVPDLLAPPDAPDTLREVRLPHLERWLARADFATLEHGGPYAWLAERHGLAAPAPVAALSLAGEGEPADGAWLRADPVHLRIDRDATVLHDASSLDLQHEEAEALVASLREHFAQDGMEWRLASPERWYVRVPENELPRTVPLDAVVGRNVFGLLPEGGQRIRWRAALTEAQMVMAANDVNATRRPAVNSVWFWGEGSLPRGVAGPYARVMANDVFARGLARTFGKPALDLVASLDAALAQPADGDMLVVLDSLTRSMRLGDEAAWIAQAAELDRAWFAALPRALARFDAVRIVLPAEARTRVARLEPSSRWRWLRRAKPLCAHA